jgi:hypothetical protein
MPTVAMLQKRDSHRNKKRECQFKWGIKMQTSNTTQKLKSKALPQPIVRLVAGKTVKIQGDDFNG